MKSISLNKVKDVTYEPLTIVLIDGTIIPISFYFIHANEIKYVPA